MSRSKQPGEEARAGGFLAMLDALVRNWPLYLMEGSELGIFMLVACVFGALLEHPRSPARRRLGQPVLRRAVMGAAMGLTAIGLIYSPWGQASGAHMNPALTLSFLALGKVAPWDAAFYVTAQVAGGTLGVLSAAAVLGRGLAHPDVNYVVTTPGSRGAGVAWGAEVAISFLLMFTVLVMSNRAPLAPFTGFVAGGLVGLYILVEAPLSGMSLNPARTLASAIPARHYEHLWVYLTAPLVGMFLATVVHARLPGAELVNCAKLCHEGEGACIFRCTHERMSGRSSG